MARSRILLSAFVSLFLLSQIAAADIIVPFSDTVKYWPTYGNGTGDDSLDSIGEPNLTGGSLVIGDNGYLKQVKIDFTVPNPGWEFSKMKPGDLFFDFGADGSWDYVVSSYNKEDRSNLNNINTMYTPVGKVALYGTAGGSIMKTGPDNAGYWAGYLIRNNHPFAFTGLTDYIGDASISGGYYNTSPVVFNLPGNKLWIGGKVTIGFAENCANDVLLATVDVPRVPEPSTFVLLGLGLVSGFVALKKRKS